MAMNNIPSNAPPEMRQYLIELERELAAARADISALQTNLKSALQAISSLQQRLRS